MIQEQPNTKPRPRTGKWWQISYLSNSGVRKIKVYRKAKSAARKSDDLFANGIPSKIQPCRTDVYVVGGRGELLLVQSRLLLKEASRMSFYYSTIERKDGVLLWPHGTKLPKALQNMVVVAAEEMEVVS